jgi:mRNA interferase RelE/StbE
MIYKLTFAKSAQKEWRKLDSSTREQFAKKLLARREAPKVLADKLSGLPNCYKIKLRSSGYRLVYRVIDAEITVDVVAVGKRENDQIYITAKKRLES